MKEGVKPIDLASLACSVLCMGYCIHCIFYGKFELAYWFFIFSLVFFVLYKVRILPTPPQIQHRIREKDKYLRPNEFPNMRAFENDPVISKMAQREEENRQRVKSIAHKKVEEKFGSHNTTKKKEAIDVKKVEYGY